MCNYCTCQDNNPVPGMRVGKWQDDDNDHQGEMTYTWNGALVESTPSNMNDVPPTGDQFRQQMIGGNGPQAGVDDPGRYKVSGG